jgi:hypothetical protein
MAKLDPLYVAYHDSEWGVPEFDDRALYEKLVLDGVQAGLSWITILRNATTSACVQRIPTRENSTLHAQKSRAPDAG